MLEEGKRQKRKSKISIEYLAVSEFQKFLVDRVGGRGEGVRDTNNEIRRYVERSEAYLASRCDSPFTKYDSLV